MTILQTWAGSPAAATLGWTVLHSLWEGAAIALVLAGGLCLLRSAEARYIVSCAAMLAMLAGCGATFVILLPQQNQNLTVEGNSGLRQAGRSPDVPWELSTRPDLRQYLPWIACCWVAGALFFQVRGAANWLAARRLRRRGVSSPPGTWEDRLDGLRARLGVPRKVELLESYLADVPVVMGYLRPVILVPAGLLTGLPTARIESILLHELAHIRRHDYLVNLWQIFTEGLLFYHPAVWWISGVIRTERENCCDDLVVGTFANAHEYATALTTLEENRHELAMAASGGSLVKRVKRLLGQPDAPRSAMAPVISALFLLATAAAGLHAWQPPAPKAENRYEKWLKEDVVYIIEDRERAAFESVGTDEERDHFMEQFWERRNPTPGAAVNAAKEEHYRRIAFANSHFGTGNLPGWKSDRGRVYIIHGPPDELESHPAGDGGTPPNEQWKYHLIEGVGQNVIIDFVDESRTGDYRMTHDPHH